MCKCVRISMGITLSMKTKRGHTFYFRGYKNTTRVFNICLCGLYLKVGTGSIQADLLIWLTFNG